MTTRSLVRFGVDVQWSVDDGMNEVKCERSRLSVGAIEVERCDS
jgi:hypothetical protein